MKAIAIVVFFAVLAVVPAYVTAAEHKCETHGTAVKLEKVKDPVCGMEISPKDAKFTHEYKGNKYYFCMKDCYQKFKAAPQKYIKK